MLRLAFDFIITWRETRTRPNAYHSPVKNIRWSSVNIPQASPGSLSDSVKKA